MKKNNRQCVGIDVSKDELETRFATIDNEQGVRYHSSETFKNTTSGFIRLEKMANHLSENGTEVFFVMEATGVYHEKLAHFLYERNRKVSVVLPNKFVGYAHSLNVKSKNDRADAKIIATMGVERKLDLWQPVSKQLRGLKHLSREREQLLNEKTVVLNQIHSEKHEADCSDIAIKRMKQRVRFLEKQIRAVDKDLKQEVAQNPILAEKVKKVNTICGVGFITAATVIAETDGFALFRNKAQLVSYTGYDVVEKQSGSSVKGKTRISKKGNKHIRRAMHFPALTAIQHDPIMRTLYLRIYEKTGIKMKGVVAVQRKLLVLIYTLWKNNTEYDANYKPAAVKKIREVHMASSLN